jgi:hypothetical protein
MGRCWGERDIHEDGMGWNGVQDCRATLSRAWMKEGYDTSEGMWQRHERPCVVGYMAICMDEGYDTQDDRREHRVC